MKLRALAASVLIASLAFCPSALSFADTVEAKAQAASDSTMSLQKGSVLSLSKAKNGLVKKGSTRYFYKNGKMVKKAWKTVKGARYYFQKNGKAATGSCKIGSKYYVFKTDGKLAKGSKTRVVTIKKVKYQVTKAGVAKSGWNTGKTNYFKKNGAMFTNGVQKIGSASYCFNSKGALIKGDGVRKISTYDYAFLCANANGVYDAARTSKLNAYASYEKECSALIPLLGTPTSVRIDKGCNRINGEDVDDATYTFRNYKLVTFKSATGKEYFCNLEQA